MALDTRLYLRDVTSRTISRLCRLQQVFVDLGVYGSNGSVGQSGVEDQLMEAALEAGADDVVTNDDGSIDVMTAFEDFLTVKDAMVEANLTPENAEVTMIPSTTVDLDKDNAEKILALVEMLEDLDDVQNVYTNADIAEDILAQF